MEIQINVTLNADKLADAIQALAGSLSGVQVPPQVKSTTKVDEIQKKKTEKAAPKEELKSEPEPAPKAEKKQEAAPELTLIDLREKFKTLQEKGLNVKEFLQEHFGTAKLPELEPAQYAEAIRLGEEAVS